MQQHDDSNAQPSNVNATTLAKTDSSSAPTKTTSTDASDPTDASVPAPKTPPAAAPAKNTLPTTTTASTPTKTPAFPAGSDLSAMIIQATVLAKNAQAAAATATTSANTTTASSNEATSQMVAAQTDLATLIAQALALVSNSKPAAKTTANSDTTTADDAISDTTPAKNPTTTDDLATLLAQAALVASVAPQTATASTTASTTAATTTKAVTQGNEIPLAILGKVATGTSTKEKKSALTSAEGNNLQSGMTTTSTDAESLTLTSLAAGASTQATNAQQLTTTHGNKNSSTEGISASGISTTGTANVEKEKAMNAILNLSDIFPGVGTNTVAQQTPADLHIQLSSNNDFEDALKQVMHIADLTQTSSTQTPLRVAIEIQTPPGAVVNVYVSKQDDGYRAQLSTNDPVALSWVQDKMSSLKSSDLGVEVRWLPPQIESSSSISTNTANDSNLSWDRGGQNQQGQQQQEDSRQPGRQKEMVLFPSLAGIGSGSFLDSFNTLGEAA
jgi:hypothetical protein